MTNKVSLDKSKIKFVLFEGVHQSALDTLHAAGYTNIDYYKKALDGNELKEAIKDAHFIGLRSRTHLTAEMIEAAPKLIAVGCFCIGTNQVDLNAAKARGIPVFNAPFSNTRSVAELVLGEILLPPLKNLALQTGGVFNYYVVAIMYTFGLELFFDFAGYSMFAIAISNLMGIRSPINFNKPFLSRDLKEFWNRWHMSLSFWFRDFVFMRMVMVMTRKKLFKNRNVTSSVAYILNMLLMGFWHGITWFYIAYGLFHGLGLVINDAWVRKKKTLNKERKKAGQAPLPENRWVQLLGMVITFHVVMISFLIFSGFLNDLWFKK